MAAHGHSSTILWTSLLFFLILKSSAEIPSTNKNITLFEMSPVGTLITTFDATGRGTCEPERMSYRLTGLGCIHRFNVGSAGKMVTTYFLDFERQAKYECLISVHSNCDEGDLPMRNINVTVNVLDVNDNRPRIYFEFPNIGSRRQTEVFENAKPETLVALVSLEDRDSGKNGEVTCTFENATSFIVKREKDAQAYRIQTRYSFDREEKNRYKIHVACTDLGEPPLSTKADLFVRVRDVNDNAPQIDQIQAPSNRGKFEVTEGLPHQSTVAKFYVSDKDAGGIHWLKCRVNPPSDHFSMERYIGADYFSLVAKKMLDYEDINRYDLTVVCKDNGHPPFSDSRNITVHVIDANDSPPKIIIYSQSQDGQFEVKENKGHGTLVAHASVFDVDAVSQRKVNCSIDNPNFLLSRVSDPDDVYLFYKILTAKTFDYESDKQEVIQMVCTDYAEPKMRSMSNITVNIVDVNDNPPEMRVLALSQVAEVKENPNSGVLVAHLSAADLDSGRRGMVECYIDHPDFRLYSVHQMQGAYNLFTNIPLIYDEKKKYQVELNCRDKGEPRKVSSMTLTINVIQ